MTAILRGVRPEEVSEAAASLIEAGIVTTVEEVARVWRHVYRVAQLRPGSHLCDEIRRHCRYGISYRDLEQMMAERGVRVDHATIYRRVQAYAPEMEKRRSGS